MVGVGPSASKRHNQLARILADALDAAAGPGGNVKGPTGTPRCSPAP